MSKTAMNTGHLDQEADQALERVERVDALLAVERERAPRPLLAPVGRVDGVEPGLQPRLGRVDLLLQALGDAASGSSSTLTDTARAMIATPGMAEPARSSPEQTEERRGSARAATTRGPRGAGARARDPRAPAPRAPPDPSRTCSATRSARARARRAPPAPRRARSAARLRPRPRRGARASPRTGRALPPSPRRGASRRGRAARPPSWTAPPATATRPTRSSIAAKPGGRGREELPPRRHLERGAGRRGEGGRAGPGSLTVSTIS